MLYNKHLGNKHLTFMANIYAHVFSIRTFTFCTAVIVLQNKALPPVKGQVIGAISNHIDSYKANVIIRSRPSGQPCFKIRATHSMIFMAQDSYLTKMDKYQYPNPQLIVSKTSTTKKYFGIPKIIKLSVNLFYLCLPTPV